MSEKLKIIINIYIQDNKYIKGRKLNQLLYLTQAWSLVANNKPFFEDNLEVLNNQVIQPETYVKYKSYGYRFIDKEDIFETDYKLNIDDLKLINFIKRNYFQYTGENLVHITSMDNLYQLTDNNNMIDNEKLKLVYQEKTKQLVKR